MLKVSTMYTLYNHYPFASIWIHMDLDESICFYMHPLRIRMQYLTHVFSEKWQHLEIDQINPAKELSITNMVSVRCSIPSLPKLILPHIVWARSCCCPIEEFGYTSQTKYPLIKIHARKTTGGNSDFPIVCCVVFCRKVEVVHFVHTNLVANTHLWNLCDDCRQRNRARMIPGLNNTHHHPLHHRCGS